MAEYAVSRLLPMPIRPSSLVSGSGALASGGLSADLGRPPKIDGSFVRLARTQTDNSRSASFHPQHGRLEHAGSRNHRRLFDARATDGIARVLSQLSQHRLDLRQRRFERATQRHPAARCERGIRQSVDHREGEDSMRLVRCVVGRLVAARRRDDRELRRCAALDE